LVGPAALDIAKQKVKKNLKKMGDVVSYWFLRGFYPLLFRDVIR
jgi:hypothetical protein